MTVYYKNRETEIFAKQKEILGACGVGTPLVFDVGANTGQSIASYRELLPTCHVHSFEPIRSVFRNLVSAWEWRDDVVLHPFALNSVDGVFPFYVTRVTEASSLLMPDPVLQQLSRERKYKYTTVEVECRTLDQVSKEYALSFIDIVKLDVQGAELEVLKGSQAMLASGAIRVIYAEVTMAASYLKQAELKRMLDFLDKFGYQLWDIAPFAYTDAGRAWSANALFLSSKTVATLESVWRNKTYTK